MPLGSLGEDWIPPKLLEAYLTFRAYLSRFIFLLCVHTHVIHDDTLCTFFRDLRYFFSWLKCSQHHVALQREVVHVMHKTYAYQYGMHVVSQLVVDLSVRKGLL